MYSIGNGIEARNYDCWIIVCYDILSPWGTMGCQWGTNSLENLFHNLTCDRVKLVASGVLQEEQEWLLSGKLTEL